MYSSITVSMRNHGTVEGRPKTRPAGMAVELRGRGEKIDNMQVPFWNTARQFGLAETAAAASVRKGTDLYLTQHPQAISPSGTVVSNQIIGTKSALGFRLVIECEVTPEIIL